MSRTFASPVAGHSSGCCGGPSNNEYWNLNTGKRVFVGEMRIIHFSANGTVRFFSVAGGSGDTVAVVQYGTGDDEPQRLAFTRSGSRDVKGESEWFSVDTAALEGPHGYGGGVVIGRECCAGKDTVPVSGVTLHFRVREISGNPTLDFAASVVNDRLVRSPGNARP